MAKKRKYPKQPKSSASLEVWTRYKERCAAVKKHNDALKQKPQKVSAIKAAIAKMKG